MDGSNFSQGKTLNKMKLMKKEPDLLYGIIGNPFL